MNTPPASDILVVDDTPANLRLLSGMLVEQGYKVRSAPNGKLALMGIKAAPPDLILLDINMPGMNGYQVCEQLKTDPQTRDIPVIFISALDQIEDKVRAFTLGGLDYITKPFQLEEVLARVKTHLTIRHLQKKLQQANADLEQANNTLEKRVEQRTAELVRLNTAAQRFVPREFLGFLHKESIADVGLGEQTQREMTVMFSDIVAFTALSERMTPQENFNYLNAYLGCVSPIIRQHRGFIDTYLGDGVMALFPESADDAVRAAIAMQREVARYTLELQAQGFPPLRIGSGLHTGKLMLGIIGEQHRWQGTVIADAVNLAARLEELTRTYDTPIVISEQTRGQLQDTAKYRVKFLDNVQIKGKQTPVPVYAISV